MLGILSDWRFSLRPHFWTWAVYYLPPILLVGGDLGSACVRASVHLSVSVCVYPELELRNGLNCQNVEKIQNGRFVSVFCLDLAFSVI